MQGVDSKIHLTRLPYESAECCSNRKVYNTFHGKRLLLIIPQTYRVGRGGRDERVSTFDHCQWQLEVARIATRMQQYLALIVSYGYYYSKTLILIAVTDAR